ncbi:MAG TPA: chalcone isomerase family protein [Labilithrix sp.]|nr:chalcone isomerase family protein [Labilithrix sp.]
MHLNRRHALRLILTASGALLFTRRATALEREPNGYYLTGSGVRVKHVGPFSAKVYAISHFMRELPATKSKAAVIALDTDKALSWRLLRDLEPKQIRGALEEGFAKNGYTDRAKIALFLGAFTKSLSEGATVQITYASAAQATTVKVSGDGTATVPGIDFMRGTWSIWFGQIDQSDLGDALIRRIPDSPKAGG